MSDSFNAFVLLDLVAARGLLYELFFFNADIHSLYSD